MCGRFTNKAEREQIEKEFKVTVNNSTTDKPRFNIAPAQMIDTVINREAETVLTELKWGLIPSWAKDADAVKGLINARAETLAEKPSFRDAFRKRRCIIPASGFYEWQKARGGKQPYYFFLKNKHVFGFAGLFENRIDKETGEILETCTIITTEANEVLRPVHDRMPVILKADNYELWLDEKIKDETKLEKLLVPYSADEMSSHAVSKGVNIPDTDLPELILPIDSL
ncbi:MAG: SOS response-associated peptidase [Acidobacteriota bacterium]|nr:SOS response-associated peptidase [Acidobacteriota bacterium]